ncbi:hypothetical protein PR202_gb20605 [Eleusine coracana subsp. coracana]|uniref:Uncharacterized protein n=1 Tax=Eleusine coracana subsp. coracana TaxID=191504 RepID=A0AAV5FB55_ELECO|nr:hypothetical protein PR202_gb20605 [Eleusine coracana subsp. coracana]
MDPLAKVWLVCPTVFRGTGATGDSLDGDARGFSRTRAPARGPTGSPLSSPSASWTREGDGQKGARCRRWQVKVVAVHEVAAVDGSTELWPCGSDRRVSREREKEKRSRSAGLLRKEDKNKG